MKLYNVLTKKKEVFRPIKDRKINIYTCGPTVYWYAHLGNFRTYIFEDILRRALKYDGYKVKQVMNITDIEDKIIKKAQVENKKILEITKPYTKIFLNDLKKLNIEKAEVYPKATEHIQEMIKIIETLLKKGYAYKGEDGSIYFNISKFKKYGQLSNLQKREIKIGARVSSDEYKKEEAQDFVLWKSKKDGEPSWKAPFGDGRPGWHIECSAMSIKYLGPSFDIHAGAIDLIFPHHENEIAQSEAATGKKFVNYWLEGGHLLVDSQKMSKSLGNIYTLKNIEEKNFDPLSFKYLTFSSHYRQSLNFTWQGLESSQIALDNIFKFIKSKSYQKQPRPNKEIIKKYASEFLTAINDDLNMPQALAVFWKALKDGQLPHDSKKQLIIKFDKVLGLGLDKIKPIKINPKIGKLINDREQLRENKQFIPSDRLRKKIESLGYEIEDTNSGPIIYQNG